MSTKPLIALIDDDVDFLDLTRHLLQRNGYRTQCFSKQEDALAEMAANKPDLIITDLMMESLDAGFSFSRRISASSNLADVPVIIVTAAASRLGFNFRPETQQDLDAMHVAAFFDKPVPQDKLMAKIAELLKTPDDAVANPNSRGEQYDR